MHDYLRVETVYRGEREDLYENRTSLYDFIGTQLMVYVTRCDVREVTVPYDTYDYI